MVNNEIGLIGDGEVNSFINEVDEKMKGTEQLKLQIELFENKKQATSEATKLQLATSSANNVNLLIVAKDNLIVAKDKEIVAKDNEINDKNAKISKQKQKIKSLKEENTKLKEEITKKEENRQTTPFINEDESDDENPNY